MNSTLRKLLGRLPLGWLQLSYNRTRLFSAIAGVTFANVLVFVQLGILGALNGSSIAPYTLFNADILVSASDSNTLSDGGNIARQFMFESSSVPGVKKGTALYIGQMEWQQSESASATLQVFGINPLSSDFTTPALAPLMHLLIDENRAVIDRRTRGIDSNVFNTVSRTDALAMEFNGVTVSAVGLLDVGSGFTADGTMMVSDQTFLRLFRHRQSGAPDHILLHIDEGVSVDVVVNRLRSVLPGATVKVNSYSDAIEADLNFQTTERPTGIIFGFGVMIGIVVGVIIVYQVLATDVTSHLKEYATFKAMGYPHTFFIGVVFEEALILAVLGFVPALVIATLIYIGLGSATGLPIEMSIVRAVLVFLGTLAACSISGAIATSRLASADPADLF